MVYGLLGFGSVRSPSGHPIEEGWPPRLTEWFAVSISWTDGEEEGKATSAPPLSGGSPGGFGRVEYERAGEGGSPSRRRWRGVNELLSKKRLLAKNNAQTGCPSSVGGRRTPKSGNQSTLLLPRIHFPPRTGRRALYHSSRRRAHLSIRRGHPDDLFTGFAEAFARQK